MRRTEDITALASDTHPTDTARVVRWGDGGSELVDMQWGLKPHVGGEAIINLRAETADLTRNRCLVPATDFYLFTGAEHPKRRWKVTLKGEPTFFLAGVWREASADWPESYAVLTIPAAPDLLPLADRQMAVIRPSDAGSWLSSAEHARELLKPLPTRSYDIKQAD